MNIFIPFTKYSQLKICESLKNDIAFKKLVISEASAQKYHSTSTNADFKAKGVLYGVDNGIFKNGTVNIDIGSGKYNTVSKFLKKHGVFNIMYDPFLQSPSQNQKAVEWVKRYKTATSTVNNVLNVIAEDDIVLNTINQAARALKEDGISIFTIYEGNKSDVGEPVGDDGYQRNEKTSHYAPMVETYFSHVDVHGNVIVAFGQKDVEKAFWPFDKELDHGAMV